MSVAVLDESGSVELMPEEELFRSENEVKLFRTADEGSGKLIITNRRIIFVGDKSIESGLFWGFRDIALFAIARGSDNFKYPAIYCQLAVPKEREDDEDIVPEELRFVPKSDLILNDLYNKMAEAAALNPDDPMSESSDDVPIDLNGNNIVFPAN